MSVQKDKKRVTVTVLQAEPIGDNERKEVRLVLSTEGCIPDHAKSTDNFEQWAKSVGSFYRNEAYGVHYVLKHLPGGTYDQLLIIMLRERASLLAPPFWDDPGKGI